MSEPLREALIDVARAYHSEQGHPDPEMACPEPRCQQAVRALSAPEPRVMPRDVLPLAERARPHIADVLREVLSDSQKEHFDSWVARYEAHLAAMPPEVIEAIRRAAVPSESDAGLDVERLRQAMHSWAEDGRSPMPLLRGVTLGTSDAEWVAAEYDRLALPGQPASGPPMSPERPFG